MQKKIKELIKRIHPRGVPEHVSIVAMGNSCSTYMKMSNRHGTNRRIASEVWAVNSLGGTIFHDLLFQMDDLKVQEARAERKPQDTVAGTLTWLKDHPKFFTSKAYPEYPGAIEFPLQEVINDLGTFYFNNTVPYAAAWAITIGVSSITLYGCDYSYEHTHKAEAGRGCLEFLLGIAHQRGIDIVVSPDSTLMDMNVPERYRFYGYDAYDMSVKRTGDRKFKIIKKLRDELPTPEEIEKRYKHE